MNANQQSLYDTVTKEAGQTGEDTRSILIRANATNEDKAAVADALGGTGAGDEFRAA